jgi:type IV fimbrial biogenesis protein FimT
MNHVQNMLWNSAKSVEQRGFNIVELMVALSIVALLMAIGVPALRSFGLQQRIGNTAQELHLDLVYARSEAITRADSVSVCTSDDGATCTGTAWTGGRIVFVDSNQNGAIDGADFMLRKGGTPAADLAVDMAPADTFISFNSRGQANEAAVFSTCHTGLRGRDLTVRSTGNPSISTPAATCP